MVTCVPSRCCLLLYVLGRSTFNMQGHAVQFAHAVCWHAVMMKFVALGYAKGYAKDTVVQNLQQGPVLSDIRRVNVFCECRPLLAVAWCERFFPITIIIVTVACHLSGTCFPLIAFLPYSPPHSGLLSLVLVVYIRPFAVRLVMARVVPRLFASQQTCHSQSACPFVSCTWQPAPS